MLCRQQPARKFAEQLQFRFEFRSFFWPFSWYLQNFNLSTSGVLSRVLQRVLLFSVFPFTALISGGGCSSNPVHFATKVCTKRCVAGGVQQCPLNGL